MSLTAIEVAPASPPKKTIVEQNENAARNAALLRWVHESYSRCKTQRSRTEQQWYLNLAFYAGKQNVSIVSTTSSANGFKLYTPKAPPWRVRLVINRVRGIIRTELAKVTSTRPRFTVVPKTSEDEDRAAARISEQIFDVIYSEKNLKHVIRRAEWWTLICGTGFLKHYWDPGAKDYEGNAGDIAIEPVTPFHVFVPDLLEQELEKQPYLIHATIKSKHWVKTVFPFLRSVDLSSSVAVSDILEDSFLGLTGAQNNNSDNVVVLEAWIKPGHPMLPQGGVVTVVGEHIAQIKESYPYKHGEFPFSKLEHVETGKFYTDSVVTDLIPIQKEYNRCYDQNTEILTSHGWKYGEDLSVGDYVLSFDPKTQRMRFTPVLEMFSKQYSGSMTVLESNQISARTSPGHKWFVKSSEGKNKIVTSLTSDHSIPLCAPVDIEGDDSYDFNRVVGLVLSDGRIDKSGRVLISQSQKANAWKCEEIEDLLEGLFINYSKYHCANDIIDYYIPAQDSAKIKQAIPNKRLSAEYIMTLGSKGLQGLFDGLILGDGMYEGSKGAKFYTSLESEADLFSMICALLGKAATVRKQKARSDWSVRPYQYIVQVKTDKFTKARVYRAKQKDEHYEGTIWCPTVETGFVYVRRNGKPYISGNTRSQIIESKNLMGRPKLLAPKGSVNAAQITSEPGQVITYTVGFNPPTALPIADLPSYVMNEVQQLQQDMDDMAGQHEISRGQNPSQVTAATALAFLKEQDDTKLSGTVESLETALEKAGRHTLHYVTQFWTTQRLVRVVGNDQNFDAQRYSSKSIKGNHDVRVESGSALPQSKAAKQAFVMDLLKLGLIPQEKGLQMLEIGGIEKIYEDYLIDVRQAQRENQKMLDAGQLITVNDFDNHQVHLEIHNKFRKGQEYENLTPEHKQVFHEHVQMHQVALQGGLMPGGVMPAGAADPNAQPPVGTDPSGIPGQPPGDPAQLQQQQPPPPNVPPQPGMEQM